MFVPVVGSVALVQSVGTYASAGSGARTVVQNCMYQLAVVAALPTKAALEAAFDAGPMAAYLAAANSRFTQSMNQVRFLDDATDAFESTTRAGVGAIGTDSSPILDCVTLYFKTALRGRSYRGFKHFVGLNEADTTGDVLTGAGLARWQGVQAAYGAVIVDALGNSWTPCVVSQKLSQLLVNPTTVVANPVSQVLLNKTVGSMRKRRVATVR